MDKLMHADSSGEYCGSESDQVKRRDRRGYIDTISNPANFRELWIYIRLKMEWVDQSNRNHIPVSALVPDRDAIFTTGIELSNNIRMRSKCFSLQNKPYYQDERCNLQSLQHFLGNLHSFLNSVDEIRLANIKFNLNPKRFSSLYKH